MANVHSWHNDRQEDTYHLPGPEHLGWWAAASVVVSVAIHLAIFFLLDRLEIDLPFSQAREINTAPVTIQRVEVRPSVDLAPVPDTAPTEPVPESSVLLDEIELLRALPEESEIDMKPDVLDAEYALQMSKPAESGDPAALAEQAASSFEIDTELPEFGRETSDLPPAAVGQVVIDPGNADMQDDSLGRMTDDLIRKGANGQVVNGTLDGLASLDTLLDLPPNLLVSKKTMLPSDLLFEFNRAELRESAKVGLMKLALLMDRNPGLHCWIEGHTDLIGSDDFNVKLSQRRADAVKSYLVDSLRMEASKIHTMGFGKSAPIVTEGDQEAQSINRRVEVRMRKTAPPSAGNGQASSAANPHETPPPRPRETTPKAKPILETPPAATPVIPAAPAAIPVAEAPPTAIPVAPRVDP